jgi:hypothetical protein
MTASTHMSSAQKPTPTPRNGIDVPTVFATINAVRAQPELAQFRFPSVTGPAIAAIPR